ncbi:MAG: hypothetical protein CM15mP98_10200 [Paracoccaceae bacterium]|nr:MAG: hypothetical protein CM15mP98_10200 [Paracoccaceae bacterium]
MQKRLKRHVLAKNIIDDVYEIASEKNLEVTIEKTYEQKAVGAMKIDGCFNVTRLSEFWERLLIFHLGQLMMAPRCPIFVQWLCYL